MDLGFLIQYETVILDGFSCILLPNDDQCGALVALCNSLILKGEVHLAPRPYSETELYMLLENKLKEACAKEEDLELAMSKFEVLKCFDPKPLLNRIGGFKHNHCSQIFEILKIPFYHGWISEEELAEDLCIEDIKAHHDAALQYMKAKYSEVTEKGLVTLKEELEEDDICLLFYKEEFHTITKFEDEIYLLVTNEETNKLGEVWNNLTGGRFGPFFDEIIEIDLSLEIEELNLQLDVLTPLENDPEPVVLGASPTDILNGLTTLDGLYSTSPESFHGSSTDSLHGSS